MPKQKNMKSQESDSEGDHGGFCAVDCSRTHDFLVEKERQGEAVDERAESATGKRENAGGKAHQFYFVKQYPFENPSLVAADKIVQHRFVIDQKRKEKLMDRDRLYSLLRSLRYHAQQWGREDLKLLKLSMDKLCFANKASLCKAIKPGSSVDEIDNLSLHFGMLHGGNSLADERRILRKTDQAQRKADPCMSKQEFDQKIWRLRYAKQWRRPDSDEERKIRDEIKELELAREKAMTSAACKGKMWDSLGSKQTIRNQVQLMEEGLNKTRQQHFAFNSKFASVEKELASVENELSSLEKELMYIEIIKGDAYKFILAWRKEHQGANACYNQCISLMEAARELAEKKDIEALCDLSTRDVEKFMHQWNRDGHWRQDYERRILASLNQRGLTRDGRRRNRDEEPIAMEGSSMTKIPRRLEKAMRARRKEDLRAEKPVSK
ncbi:proton pump-interactor 1-like [Rhodamnia argentea]|uniref:Proton pump-interactor 1-like n=1 Tax=Rhodamnia argentea TaxID=178133 RepID=A0ABM3H5P7_9MYRT|nr:proton pump-interactor 1-like [Rhodamnia argentea]